MGVLPMLTATTLAKAAGAFAAMAVAATIGGLGSAAAQPDLNTLPVDPNLLTDSLAYSSVPFVLNPNGQQGIKAEYNHREGGTRSITTSILLYPNEQAALASLSAAAAGVGNPRKIPAPVGDNGTLVAGTSPNGGSTSVLTFTQGNAATTIEFDGPINDPAPDEFVIDLGKKQDTAILDWQGV